METQSRNSAAIVNRCHNCRAGRGILFCGFLAAFFLTSPFVQAQEPAPRSALTARQLADFRVSGVPAEELPAVLEAMGSKDVGGAVGELFRQLDPFPAAALVEMLRHPRLQVRSGALDILEEAADSTFGFDPWAPDSPAANADALKRWEQWLQAGGIKPDGPLATLDEESFRAMAMEVMTGERERSERAIVRMEPFGLEAVGKIERFLAEQPTLEPSARASLKAAEYRLVLRQSMDAQAGLVARDLAAGTPEMQSKALDALARSGPSILPIVNDLLHSPDALVRETAVDTAFAAGKGAAVGLILERLPQEKSENVLIAMLRGTGSHSNDEKSALEIAEYLSHPSENVVITALEALSRNTRGDLETQMAGLLDHARWRVRAAALEAIGARRLGGLSDKTAGCLEDSDEFVRVTAVRTLLKMDAKEDLLIARFSQRDDLKAPILRGLLDDNKTPPESVWKALDRAPPEVVLQCLNALEDRSDRGGQRLRHAGRFVRHGNRDVAATAYRLLASRGLRRDLLLEALTSKDAGLSDAVLDDLHLPSGSLLIGSLESESARPAKPNPIITSIFRLLGEGSDPAAGEAAAANPSEGARLRETLEGFWRNGSPNQKFRAALVLVSQGHPAAGQWLLESLQTLSSLERREVAGTLAVVDFSQPGPFQELASQLLRDEAGEVREQAVEAWVDTDKPELLASALREFSRRDGLLAPEDLYAYSLDRLARNSTNWPAILEWGRGVLSDAGQPDRKKVLAIILLGRSGQARQGGVEAFQKSDNPWLRRAAFRAFGTAGLSAQLKAILSDESAMVRAVLPFLAAPEATGWLHWFDDAHFARDAEDFDRGSLRSGAAADPNVTQALQELAKDPSEHVRFEAAFALLRLGQTVDPAPLARLAGAQKEETEARQRLGNFLEANYGRLGQGYGALVAAATGISTDNLQRISQHFGLGQVAAVSFAELGGRSETPPAVPEMAVAPADPAPRPQTPFGVLFFFKQGCRECDRVRSMLNDHAATFAGMTIQELDISDRRNALLNEVLSKRFEVEDALHQVAPGVFTRGGAVVGRQITFPELGNLFRKTADLPPGDEQWARAEEPELASAQTVVEKRYEALSFWVVFAAGLLDGVNPCAFATIILLLSYLQVARRSPQEILAVGGAFVAAVFLSYFAVGLGLAQLLARIAALRVAGNALAYCLAAFAAVIAVLSFRDARLAARGDLAAMALQLPAPLKDRIRETVRSGARAPRFVAAAFVAGIVISFLELACTGQVYLPTILYMLRSGHAGALGHLTLYNVAFVTPLIIVFALAWAGMRSDALIRFQQRHTALVKVLTGILFLFLAAFLVFGSDLLAQPPGAP